ncbi:MAG: hypothetical protein ACT4QC_18415 [Planctomycetaceae bacterium]
MTTVCPGMMRTGSPRNAEFKGRKQAEYAWFSIALSLPVVSTNSTRAARRIIEACRRGDAEVLVSGPAALAVAASDQFRGASSRFLELVNHFLPRAINDTSSSRGWQCYSDWSPSWITTLNERAARKNHELLSTANVGNGRLPAAAPTSAALDEALEESFPASDPPATTPVTRVGAIYPDPAPIKSHD